MGPRRLGFALLAALVISIAITTVFYLRVTRQGSHPSKPVVAAAVPLQPGTPIAAESLTEIAWPENVPMDGLRSEEHTSELQSPCNLVCRLLLEKKKRRNNRMLTRLQRASLYTR